jgi:two-component system OmpR family response regulator
VRILLVEDDSLVADVVASGLRDAGFVVDAVASAESAETAIATEHFDLVVLDLGLPGRDGLQFLSSLRRGHGDRAGVPVLVLTARDGLDDRIEGLERGADDYMVKPFELRELVARCRVLIRRTGSVGSSSLGFLGLELDRAARVVRAAGRSIELTPREWSILEYLMLHAETVVRKDKLLQAISGWDDNIAPNAIEVYVSRLRGKIEDTGVAIRTVRGVGYRLERAPDG